MILSIQYCKECDSLKTDDENFDICLFCSEQCNVCNDCTSDININLERKEYTSSFVCENCIHSSKNRESSKFNYYVKNSKYSKDEVNEILETTYNERYSTEALLKRMKDEITVNKANIKNLRRQIELLTAVSTKPL
jgi:hypothetical protein